MLVVDVDVHQGDGTHALLGGDADAFTLSLNGFRNYPFRRVPGDLEVELPDGTGDDRYLAELASVLPQAVAPRRGPSSASCSPAPTRTTATASAGSPSRRRASSSATRLVRDTLAAAGVPVCVTLAGGYAEDIRDTVEINLGTVRTFSASRS